MAKKEEKSEEKKATMKRRKPKKPKSIFYCMNERELVETAVSLLTQAADSHDAVLLADHKVEDGFAGKTRASTSRENPAMQEAAYVSETDLDVSEMETLPYTKSPTHQEPGGQMSEPGRGQGARRNVGLEAGRKKQNSQEAAEEEEEDAFQLVREIFFAR